MLAPALDDSEDPGQRGGAVTFEPVTAHLNDPVREVIGRVSGWACVSLHGCREMAGAAGRMLQFSITPTHS